jgi:hypothetical protein
LFAESIKIWFLFNQRFLMIILCWFKQVINKDIISFLCFCIMTDVYKAYVIDFQSRVSSYNWINFNFNNDSTDWISKHSHSSDIKNSSMNVMSMTLMSIRVRNRNIFFKLFKIMLTVNDLKLKESLSMLIKQDMNVLLSITTLMKTDRFLNLQWFHALESFQNIHMLYVLSSCI